MRILGIDPGVRGGVAIVEVNNGVAPKLVDAIDVPTVGIEPALSGVPLLEVEGIVKHVHQQIEDALRNVISCAVEAIIDVQQDMIETPHEPRRR
jgi:hypothetical protein